MLDERSIYQDKLTDFTPQPIAYLEMGCDQFDAFRAMPLKRPYQSPDSDTACFCCARGSTLDGCFTCLTRCFGPAYAGEAYMHLLHNFRKV